jgi:uncharacterized protein (DUF952 family)
MQIFHIAEKSRWEAASLSGAYAQSTLDLSLEEEGFIHASRAEQVDEVRARHYAGVSVPLVLLTIETDKLTSPWREEPVGDTTYPHIHGPINPSAVVAVTPLDGSATDGRRPESSAADGPQRTFLGEFLAEFSFRMGAAVFVMVAAAVCGFIGIGLWGDGAGLWALLGGALLASAAVVPVSRWRDAKRDADLGAGRRA